VKARNRVLIIALAALALTLPGLTACAPGADQTLQQKANAEATAIIAQAEATAVVLRARATASALMQVGSGQEEITDEPATLQAVAAEEEPTPVAEPAAPAAEEIEAAPQANEESTPELAATAATEVLQVGFGSDGTLISVAYKAAPTVARKWMQGIVYVLDEETGTKYGNVPVMPKVGPLLGRPKEYGQVAYIMFVNGPVPLAPGDIVTVVLGDYKQEHVKVR